MQKRPNGSRMTDGFRDDESNCVRGGGDTRLVTGIDVMAMVMAVYLSTRLPLSCTRIRLRGIHGILG